VRVASGKQVPAFHTKAKVEKLVVDGGPTATASEQRLVCVIESVDLPRNTYTLKVDRELTSTFSARASEVGHNDYLNKNGELQKAVPNQPWRMWYGGNSPMAGSVFFNPYGRGPYIQGSVFERYVGNRPTGLLARIVGSEPQVVEDEKTTSLKVGGGGSLDSLTYQMQYCLDFNDTFDCDAATVHASWRVLEST